MAKFKTVGEEIADEPEQIYDEAIEMSENLPPANDGNTNAQYEALQVAKTSDLKRPSKRRFQHLKVAVVVVVALINVALIAVIVFLVTRDRTTTNGGWSVWSAWSSGLDTFETNKTCPKTRQRQCNNPVPSGGGKYCEGNAYNTTHCEQKTDSATNGGWSVWSLWSSCTKTLATSKTSLKTRQRQCNNPVPFGGGKYCEGNACDTTYCEQRSDSVTNGGWSVWSAWAFCSETCVSSKTGLKIRQRQCNNPVPSEGGKYCEGNAYDTTHCNLQSVLEVKGTRAWQSSTWADCYANYSIDGKLVEYFCPYNKPCKCLCAHTDSANSSWVMEFECPGTVKEVALYFRSTHEHRNTDFKILVYDSFEAAKNDARGTACITYTGAGIVSKKTLLCDEPVYGKALRIQHFVNLKNDPYPNLQICETRVFLH